MTKTCFNCAKFTAGATPVCGICAKGGHRVDYDNAGCGFWSEASAEVFATNKAFRDAHKAQEKRWNEHARGNSVTQAHADVLQKILEEVKK